VTAAVRLSDLQPSHRSDIASIVRATAVFSEAEVDVALELFDDAIGSRLSALGTTQSPKPKAQSFPDYEFVGAFIGDRLVGYACFGLTPATDRTYDLYWIAVHPDAQRTGAGAALMAEVERRLEERRARLVIVETSSRDDYEPTRRFYAKRGYGEHARLRDFYAAGDDRVILGKRLVAAPAPATAGQ
jgi:ribosomal protein S18 acetylase RimI-like enzyme